MRARRNRFRPSVDFRPGLDLLMPRIAPSDITTMIASDPAPVPDDSTDDGDDDPYVIPPAPVNSLPNGYVSPTTTTSTSSVTAAAPASTSTTTISTS